MNIVLICKRYVILWFGDPGVERMSRDVLVAGSNPMGARFSGGLNNPPPCANTGKEPRKLSSSVISLDHS